MRARLRESMAWGGCKVGERCAEREQATIAQVAPHRPLSCRATVPIAKFPHQAIGKNFD